MSQRTKYIILLAHQLLIKIKYRF